LERKGWVTGKISEIFDSIQGEGIYLGEKQLFIRFYGCNLNCKFCDTKLNYFREYEPEELFKELNHYQEDFHSVAFTGGEPLLQKDFLKEVLKFTAGKGYKNYLETNGTLYKELEDVIDYLDIIAMDIKLPSSTACKKYWQEHRKFMRIASRKELFLKMVICESTSESDIKESLALIEEVNKAAVLVLQPDSHARKMVLKKKIKEFREVFRQNHISSCIIPQVHKLIGAR